jgi:DNA invertase Pin-like site-specific DNA recombinase
MSPVEGRAVRAGIYARISKDSEGRAAGVGRQQRDGEDSCRRWRWTVHDVYVDNDISAYDSRRRRPEYERLKDDLKNGVVNAVVVWHPDRLHRQPRELEDFIDLIETTGATVGTVTAGEYDLGTPTGRQTARIVGAVARGESEHKAERIRRKARASAEAGAVWGGNRPYGYEADRRTIRKSEARFIREAVDRVLAGESIHSICKTWNERGVPTVSGIPWGMYVLRRILTSGRIAGWREHHGELVAEAEWDGIIDLETLEALRAILRDPDRTKRKMPVRRYLLTGLARCGRCGEKLVARPRPDGRRCYVCSNGLGFKGCGRLSQLADPLEELVVESTFVRLNSPGTLRALQRDTGKQDQRRTKLTKELQGYEKRLKRLQDEYSVEGIWKKSDFMRQRNALEDRIDRLQRSIGRDTEARFITRVPSGERALRKWWDDANIEQRRALIAAVADRVIIKPADRTRHEFQPERVDVIWRA